VTVSETILVGKSAQEWFREMVTEALSQRRLKVQEITEFYLVNLLATFVRSERLFVEDPDGQVREEPLALILLEALSRGGQARSNGLRKLGDTALFVSGFFGDSIARSAVDVDYYVAMGERAYGALADAERPTRQGLADGPFAELASRFSTFVDLFSEIAELSQLRSNRGLLRLYERYLLTRDARVAERLRERGVALFAGPGAPRRDLLQ
jgi:hypothetical protein